jgi:hypothetical protein
MAKHGVTLDKDNRSIDLTDPTKAVTEEIKSGEIGAGDIAQVKENATVVGKKAPLTVDGKPVTPKQTRLRMTSPEAAKTARAKLIDLLTEFQSELTVIVYNAKGQKAEITYNGRDGTHDVSFLGKNGFEAWLGL